VQLVLGQGALKTGDRVPSDRGVLGHVITTGQPYLTNDGLNDPIIALTTKSLAPAALGAVPLVAQAETIGALLVGRDIPIGEAEMRLLTAIAEIAASAMRRSALFEETQRRLNRLDALHAIDKAITTNLDLESTLAVALEQVTSHLGAAAAVILRNEAETQTLLFAAGRGFRANNAIQSAMVRFGQGYAGWVAVDRHPLHIPDLCSEKAVPPVLLALAEQEGFTAYIAVPLIARGQVEGVLELFQRGPLEADEEWWNFLDTLARQIAIAIDNATLFKDLQNSNLELTLAYDTTLEGWAKALELRDKETQGHSERVTDMTLRLARAMGMSGEELVHVRRGTRLHDIGKMGIPDHILLKPGPLTDEEWQIMRQHPVYARDLLSPIPYLQKALDVPTCHHERWDGSGYPHGLKGTEIPLAARIFALVDVWDALLSDRPYRPPWPEVKVLEYLRAQSGVQFDPRVVQAFFEMLAEKNE
jgi:HD-GYP domain-containing protein (c-di-GMP phosphodiesterase class II)